MYYIKISGFIPPEKVNEFRITADSCFASWKHRCQDLNFSKDLIYSDLCHYLSTWDEIDSYRDFMRSEEFKVLEGCFRSLGYINMISHGKMTSEEEN